MSSPQLLQGSISQNLRYWELDPYSDSPTTPFGYLLMLYIALFLPFYYHRIMAKKLIHWVQTYASDEEKNIAIRQNNLSNIESLLNYKINN